MQKEKIIYIHIGTPKTGTSAIQRFLFENKTLLAQKDIFYPTVGRYNLTDEFIINGSLLFDKKQCEETLNIFSKNQFSTMILSEELLFLYLRSENCFANADNVLWELLSNYEVKIIVYLRRSAEYLTSQWQQDVKQTSKQTFEEYLETTNYAESLEAIDDLSLRVGLDNMIVKTYEPTRWLNNDLIDDFLNIMDIEKSNEFLLLKSRQNVGLSRDYCERILFVNQHFKS